MKSSEVYGLLRRTGIPVTYRQFKGPKEDIPDPPFIAYYEGQSRNFGADNVVCAEKLTFTAELYTDSVRDFGLEGLIKELLTEAGVFFNTSHADIDEENVHIAYFEFTLLE